MDFGEARRAATISGPAGPQEGMGEAIAERLKVLIADDNARIRAGLAEILDRDKSVELVGQAEDGEVAVQMARELRPDIVLMDLHMPRRNGLQATHQLRQELPEVRVLMLTVSDKEPNLLEAMRGRRARVSAEERGPRADRRGRSVRRPRRDRRVDNDGCQARIRSQGARAPCR